MKKPQKIPLRKCIGCSESKPKQELIRIVKNKENEVFIDNTGKANGRGAYLCRDTKCFDKAIKHRAIQRALSQDVPEETIDALRHTLEDL